MQKLETLTGGTEARSFRRSLRSENLERGAGEVIAGVDGRNFIGRNLLQKRIVFASDFDDGEI